MDTEGAATMPREVSVSKSNSKAKRKRRSFTAEYKAEVVRLVRESGKTIGQIARELDLTETAVRAWVERATIDDRQDPEGPLTTEERAELARLRRDNKRLEMERDILKKAAAFFAKESS
jgi:transposase-like protein